MSDDPFALFGLAPDLPLDTEALRRIFLARARDHHPDFHQDATPEEMAKQEAASAALNASYRQLSDPPSRLDAAIVALGGPAAQDHKRLPAEFLEDVLAWRTDLEEAAPAALPAMAERFFALRTATLTAADEDLAAKRLPAARERWNMVRYLDGLLAEIANRGAES